MAKTKRTAVEYRNYILPSQFPLLLLSGDYWRISDIPSDRLHFHNCLEIGICHSDSGSLMVFDEEIPFQAGDVTVIPKNVPHTTYSTSGTESLWSYIFFDPKEMFRNMLPTEWKNATLSRRPYRGMPIVFGKDKYPEIYQLVTAAVRELTEQKQYYQITVRGLLLCLSIALTRVLSSLSASEENARRAVSGQSDSGNYPSEAGKTDMRTTPPRTNRADTRTIPPKSARTDAETMSLKAVGTGAENNPPDTSTGWDNLPEIYNTLLIAPALDYIEKNYYQQFSVEYLAELCHWCPAHFRKVFGNIMHITPLAFLNYTRISNACSLLLSTDDSILDISEAVGFHNVSSFNRCFTKIMHMSPREYRKDMKNPMNSPDSPYIVGYSGWIRPEIPQKELD